MFTLYYFIDTTNSKAIFTNEDLGPCLAYIKANFLVPQRCLIISPNNRRITFNNQNDLVFGKSAA